MGMAIVGAISGQSSYDRAGPRRAVNLSLNEDLVSRAKTLTPSLSRTVETLLAAYVAAEEARRREDDARLEETLDLLDALHERDGLLSDHFPSL